MDTCWYLLHYPSVSFYMHPVARLPVRQGLVLNERSAGGDQGGGAGVGKENARNTLVS